jgi:glycosyltransferase involved in cell wall biosynthesis
MALAICNHGLRNSGGIERYALTLVRELHRRGIRPVFIAKAFDTELPEAGWVDPIRVRLAGVPNKVRDLVFDWRIAAIKRARGLFPLLACNQTRAADIAICGSTHPGYLAAMGQRAAWSDRWRIRLEHAHLNNARIVVAHSRRMADEAVRWHRVTPANVRVLYPPVDATRFSTVDALRRAALRSRFDLPADRAVFLLASTGHRRKGFEMLVEFFRTTDLPACLAVAGRPIPSESERVRYLGYLADIENAFRAADFTIVASRYEPFGLVGVESVLCGTALVLARNVGCAEVIRAGAQIGFDLDAPGTFAAAMASAVQRWRAREHRIAAPLACLDYDPSVAVHVDTLLQIAGSMTPAAGA